MTHIYEIIDRNNLHNTLNAITNDWKEFKVKNIVTKEKIECDKLNYIGTIEREFDW
jgi:hypothetical protein